MPSLLRGIKRFGGNLLDVAQRYGEMQYSPDADPELEAAAGPQAEILRRQYDRNFRNQRGAAIRQGARWYEMNDMAAEPAQEQHQSALMRAVQIADALKERRLREGRTGAIKSALEGMTDLTPKQKELVAALPYEEQSKVLTKHLFPTLDGADNVATSGTVVGTFKGANGNMHAVVQTGDPANPVKSYDTGVKDDRTPSEIRTLQSYEQRPEHLETRQRRSFAERYGTEAAAFQSGVEATLPEVVQSSQAAIISLSALKEKLANLPTGRLVGPALLQVNAELQAIHAELTEVGLKKIGELKAMGISLQPITEKELRVLFDTSAQMKNLPAANVKIIERQIDFLQSVIDNANERLDWVDSGQPALSWRPRKSAPPSGGGGSAEVPPPPPGFTERVE